MQVKRILTDEGLPFTGGPGVTSKESVGLKTELSSKGGLKFADIGAVTREQSAFQESLQKDP